MFVPILTGGTQWGTSPDIVLWHCFGRNTWSAEPAWATPNPRWDTSCNMRRIPSYPFETPASTLDKELASYRRQDSARPYPGSLAARHPYFYRKVWAWGRRNGGPPEWRQVYYYTNA